MPMAVTLGQLLLVCLFFQTICQKVGWSLTALLWYQEPMQLESPNLTYKCCTTSPGNPFLLASKGHNVCVSIQTERGVAAAQAMFDIICKRITRFILFCLLHQNASVDFVTWHVWMQAVSAREKSTGFPRLLESPGFLFVKFSGPGKSWKMGLVLKSPGNFSERSWKVLEFSRLWYQKRTQWCRCKCRNFWKLLLRFYLYINTKKSLAAGAAPRTPQ